MTALEGHPLESLSIATPSATSAALPVRGAADQTLGGALAVLGGLIAIVGINGQRWALKSKTHAMARWYAALGVYIAGQVVQVAAYAYGTQELVAAMSNLSLVWNSLICTLIFN